MHALTALLLFGMFLNGSRGAAADPVCSVLEGQVAAIIAEFNKHAPGAAADGAPRLGMSTSLDGKTPLGEAAPSGSGRPDTAPRVAENSPPTPEVMQHFDELYGEKSVRLPTRDALWIEQEVSYAKVRIEKGTPADKSAARIWLRELNEALDNKLKAGESVTPRAVRDIKTAHLREMHLGGRKPADLDDSELETLSETLWKRKKNLGLQAFPGAKIEAEVVASLQKEIDDVLKARPSFQARQAQRMEEASAKFRASQHENELQVRRASGGVLSDTETRKVGDLIEALENRPTDLTLAEQSAIKDMEKMFNEKSGWGNGRGLMQSDLALQSRFERTLAEARRQTESRTWASQADIAGRQGRAFAPPTKTVNRMTPPIGEGPTANVVVSRSNRLAPKQIEVIREELGLPQSHPIVKSGLGQYRPILKSRQVEEMVNTDVVRNADITRKELQYANMASVIDSQDISAAQIDVEALTTFRNKVAQIPRQELSRSLSLQRLYEVVDFQLRHYVRLPLNQ